MRTGALLAAVVTVGLLSAAAASRPRRQLASDVPPPPPGLPLGPPPGLPLGPPPRLPLGPARRTSRPLLSRLPLGSRRTQQPTQQPRPTQQSRPGRPFFSIAESINSFTSALGEFIGDGNVVLSPFSIVSVLNLLLLGANNDTYTQLRTALRYPSHVDDLLIHQQSGIQLRALRRERQGVNVQIANRIFTDSVFNINEAFSKQARDFYEAGVEQLEFGKSPEVAKRRINTWVRDHTAGQIQKVFDRAPPKNTRMIAANVVYFNSSWQTPFNPADTKMLSFKQDDGRLLCVPTMFAGLTVPFVARDSFSAVALPYSGGGYAMVILLPNRAGEKQLSRLEHQLSDGGLQHVLRDMRSTNLSVWMPRFKLEYTLALRDILTEMGVTDLFQESRATLDRMTPDRQIFLNEVLHQAVIDVHEAGTEASAVTVSLINRDRVSSREFRVNKPFLFVILDSGTEVPLFYGRMVLPEESVPHPGKGQGGCNGGRRGGTGFGGGVFGGRPGGPGLGGGVFGRRPGLARF